MAKNKKGIWLSYDMGLKGDFTSLFTWLDNKQALECGNGLAFFRYDYDKSKLSDTHELIEQISKEIKQAITLSKSDRMYIIWKDDHTNKIKGEFINGGRKQAPWEGYGNLSETETDVDE